MQIYHRTYVIPFNGRFHAINQAQVLVMLTNFSIKSFCLAINHAQVQ
jgi:hypothetical protein